MTRLLIAAAVAAAVIAPTAGNAANSRHHRQQHYVYHQSRHFHQDRHRAYYGGRMSTAPVFMPRRAGPPWAGPNQCYEDLGYGRYESCDAD